MASGFKGVKRKTHSIIPLEPIGHYRNILERERVNDICRHRSRSIHIPFKSGSEAVEGDASSKGGRPRSQRLPSLRLANGRISYGTPTEPRRTNNPHNHPAVDDEEFSSSAPRRGSNNQPQHNAPGPPGYGGGGGPVHRQDSIKISVDNTHTGTDSLVTAPDEDLVNDYISPEMNFKESGGRASKEGGGEKDDVSLYGTPKEEIGPNITEAKPGFVRNQLEALFQPSDNKLAMKLFGSKKALMKERIRQKAAGNWIIHPCSKFRFYWDLCMLLVLVTNLIVLPVAISFFNDDLSARWIAFNCLSDTLFLLDIIVNFRTGIMQQDNSEQVILDPKEIARHYIRTWFFLDLLSSIPFDYIFLIFNQGYGDNYQLLHAGRALRILRFAKMLSLLRLLRLSRLVRYVSQWEEVYVAC